jgi:hypothetical protein
LILLYSFSFTNFKKQLYIGVRPRYYSILAKAGAVSFCVLAAAAPVVAKCIPLPTVGLLYLVTWSGLLNFCRVVNPDSGTKK